MSNQQPTSVHERPSIIRRGRTSKGRATARVIRHGRAGVQGDTYPADVNASAIPASVIQHEIETSIAYRDRGIHAAPTTFGAGTRVDTLADIATRAYDLPPLLGTEHRAFEEVTPPMPSADLDATHVCGITGGVNPDIDRAVFPYTWHRAARVRINGWRTDATASRVKVGDDTYRVIAYLPGAARKDETERTVERTVIARTVRDVTYPTYVAHREVTQLRAGHWRDGHAYIGHDARERPASVREEREDNRRGVDQAFVIPRAESVADHLAGIAATVPSDDRGYRYTWRRYGSRMTGTLTATTPDVHGRRRFSVTMPDGTTVRGQRTPRGLARKLSAIA